MSRRNQGFAHKIRKIMQRLGAGGRVVTAADVARELDFITDREKQPIYRTIRGLRKSGEVELVARGVYRYLGKTHAPELQEIMWRILRARRQVTVGDLMELAGAAENTVQEWLRMLARNNVVKRVGIGTWKMISDPVTMPRNERKAAKLKRLRERKKNALAQVDQLVTLALETRLAINDIPENGDDE